MAKNADDAPDSKLSPRELEILKLLCDGLTANELAAQLGISAKTVEFHRNHIGKKAGATYVVLVVRWAIRHKLIEP